MVVDYVKFVTSLGTGMGNPMFVITAQPILRMTFQKDVAHAADHIQTANTVVLYLMNKNIHMIGVL